MKYKNLLILLLISLHVPFSHAAQESQIQDEPFVIVPFDQFLDETVTNHQNIDEIFTFLHEQGCINTSFRQLLQRKLVNDEDENNEQDASFDAVLELAHEIIATNMKGRFIETLDAAMIKKKSLDKFHDPIFLYVMQHKDDSMHDVVRDWLHEWSKIKIKYYNQVPLHRAVINNHIEVVQLLIAAGADINLQDREDKAPLHMAVIDNHTEIARLLIGAGTDVNIQTNTGSTPLHSASPEVARLLIDAGANLNIQEGWFSDTPLHRAIIDHRPEVARLLIDAGADINLQDIGGDTPLHVAAFHYDTEIACLLIDVGINLNLNLNLQNHRGQTPLHLVVINNRTEIARLLITNGADVNIQDNAGRIAEHRANTPEMRALFIQDRARREAINNQNAASYCIIS